jgi:hypothetical protein
VEVSRVCAVHVPDRQRRLTEVVGANFRGDAILDRKHIAADGSQHIDALVSVNTPGGASSTNSAAKR